MTRGETMTAARAAALAALWYADRLEPAWHPKDAAAINALFERAGLSGSFWRV